MNIKMVGEVSNLLKVTVTWFCLFTITQGQKPKGSKLLVVMVDGFRWNYFDKFTPGDLPGFEYLEKEGVKAEFLQPVFPANSYNNYYTLMTGLYPESNGFLDNYMYDPERKTEFLIGTNPEQYEAYWWEEGDPLWITATRQGQRAYMWYWCGCEVEIRGLRPAFCAAYLDNKNPGLNEFKVAVDEALEVFKNGSGDVAGIYYMRTDSIGHTYGPNSVEIKLAIQDFDIGLQYLQNKMETMSMINDAGDEVPLEEEINLILFSDHGMNELTCANKTDCIIRLDKAIDAGDLEVWNTPSQIWPKPGKLDEVYDALKSAHPQLSVWKLEDLPDYLHWKNHYRSSPIVVSSNPGYLATYWDDDNPIIGHHGYMPETIDMRGIFFAKGPAFKKNFKKVGFENAQIYQLMCHLQGLEASPHNGTWSYVEDMLEIDDIISGAASIYISLFLITIEYLLL